ncbi:MAG: threonylcarbamoyl-AMP synthase [Rhizobiaceae bacterium]|nr:threonylcarbamoyl-AMP synthase [Rhizobiaceae bacterium]
MQTLKFFPDTPEFDAVLAQSVEQLGVGGLVAVPTETVYGLAADASNGLAVASVFEMKGRPQFNPLIVHVSNLEMAEAIGIFDDKFRMLAERFWPGPLTLIVEKKPSAKIHDLVSANLPTIALRCPRGGAQKLIAAFGRPLAAPSANRSGKVSPTSAAHVATEFSGEDIVLLDGGECEVGIESTIVGMLDGKIRILRPGLISAEELSNCTGLEVSKAGEKTGIIAPGMMQSHYAPRSKLILDCLQPENNAAMLALGAAEGHLNLSRTGDLREAASNLYRHIRELDQMGKDSICVSPIPHEGLGIAINDRLARAAAPRERVKGE